MTNDQKLQGLINDVASLLDALDKAEQTGSIMHRDAARKLRKELRVWIVGNRSVKVEESSRKKAHNEYPTRKRNNAVYFSSNINEWLAQ